MATTTFEIGVDVDLKSLEDLKKELKTLEADFETALVGSDRFKELGKQVKAARNQVKDLEAEFEGLDKEQRATALVDTFNGLTGAVGAVSSAFIAFGASSEEIENAERKLLGVIGVVSGLRDVSNATVAATKLFGPTFSALGDSIKTAFTTGTKAAQGFKIALTTLGIGAVILALDLLIQNWDKVIEALGLAESEQEKWNREVVNSQAAIQGQVYAQQQLLSVVNDTTQAESTRKQALIELNKAGVITEDINLDNAASLQILNERVAENIQLSYAKAEADARQQILAKALEKQFQDQNSTLEDNISFWDKTVALVMSGGNSFAYTINKVKAGVENLSETQKENERIVTAAADALNKANAKVLELEGKRTATASQVRQALEGQKKAQQDYNQALKDTEVLEKNKLALEQRIASDSEILFSEGLDQQIFKIQQNYEERLRLAQEYWGVESAQYLELLKQYEKEVTDAETAYNKEQEDKNKAKLENDLAMMKAGYDKKIQDFKDYSVVYIEAAKDEGERAKRVREVAQMTEELETEAYYNNLINIAKVNEQDTVALEEAKAAAVQLVKDKYRQEDIDKEKAYREQIKSLAIDSALALIGSLKELNTIYDKNSTEAAKKSFQRQKSLNMVETIISTYSAAQKAYASQFVPVPDTTSPVRGQIAAAVAIAGGLARLAVISKQQFNAGGTPSVGGGGAAGGGASRIPQPQTPGGFLPGTPTTPSITPTGPGTSGMPLRAYVLAGDVTSAQSADARLNQRRTL